MGFLYSLLPAKAAKIGGKIANTSLLLTDFTSSLVNVTLLSVERQILL